MSGARLPVPVVCMVTSRHRLPGASLDRLVALAAAAADAGAGLIQIREPDLGSGPLLDLTQRIVRATSGTGTLVVVNDRLDVAIAAGASGVHLPEHSMPPDRVRAHAPAGFLVGCSVHDAARAADVAGSVDYVVMGSVFATRSKPPGAPVAGLARLAEVCRATAVPVLAIGGITAARAREVAAAGAAGVAAIGLFADTAAGARGVDRTALDAAVLGARDAFRPVHGQTTSDGPRLPVSAD